MNTFMKRIEHLISQTKTDNLVVVFTDRAGQLARLPFPEWKAQGYTFDSFIKLATGDNLNQVTEILDMVDSVID